MARDAKRLGDLIVVNQFGDGWLTESDSYLRHMAELVQAIAGYCPDDRERAVVLSSPISSSAMPALRIGSNLGVAVVEDSRLSGGWSWPSQAVHTWIKLVRERHDLVVVVAAESMCEHVALEAAHDASDCPMLLYPDLSERGAALLLRSDDEPDVDWGWTYLKASSPDETSISPEV